MSWESIGSLPISLLYSCFLSILPGEVMQYRMLSLCFKQSSSSSLWVPGWWSAPRPPMGSKLLHCNLIAQQWRPVKWVFFFPLTAVCLSHVAMWYRMKLAQVSVCDINLELLFDCHHWPCHHFVTCLLDFVNCSWVSEIIFIPVECACSVCMRASPLTPHTRLSLPMGLFYLHSLDLWD